MLKQVTLEGEQTKVLFLPPLNPIQIKGVAGSGKTTVALYRAQHLLENYADMFRKGNIAIFTFNKTLASYITALTSLNHSAASEGEIQVTNFHSWAWHFLFENGNTLVKRTISGGSQIGLLTRAINSLPESMRQEPIMAKSVEFFREEISWIKGKLFKSLDEYLDAKRIGRGTSDRVTQRDKETIWEVYEAYQSTLKALRHIDFDDFAPLALEIIELDSEFRAPFTHIVIDEAQDLNKAQVLVLARLVDSDKNSISVIADAAQRIYKSGFTWSEVGINVRGGRTVEFKKNYRNTLGIVAAAASLLAHDSDSDDFTQIEPHSSDAKRPSLDGYRTEAEELMAVASRILQVAREHPEDSICVLHRVNQGIQVAGETLRNIGLETMVINGNADVDYNDDSIKLSTMSSIKGLEFDHVYIIGLGEHFIPAPAGFSEPGDELHVSTERRLLYTSMTRACKSLHLSYHGQPSRYLHEIEPELLEVSEALAVAYQ